MITSVAITKRLIDIVLGVLVLVITAPFWVVIGLLIKLDSPGPVLYTQKRLRQKTVDPSSVTEEDMFDIYKFRTMRDKAEELTGAIHAARDDPRVTRVGKFLRATRLDELPNFINVVNGDMSVIGPRADRLQDRRSVAHLFPTVWNRTQFVKPGITGLAQISLKSDGSMESEYHRLLNLIPSSDIIANANGYRYKLYYDFSYACQLGNFWTFLVTDLKIAILTPVVMFFKRNTI